MDGHVGFWVLGFQGILIFCLAWKCNCCSGQNPDFDMCFRFAPIVFCFVSGFGFQVLEGVFTQEFGVLICFGMHHPLARPFLLCMTDVIDVSLDCVLGFGCLGRVVVMFARA